MQSATCPSCGADVPVSAALFCPFCGQALRKVFATQPASSSDASLPSYSATPGTTLATEQPITTPPSGAQTMWTPYPGQGTLPSMRAPAPPSGPMPPPPITAPPITALPYVGSPAGNYPYASAPEGTGPNATTRLVRMDRVIGATAAVVTLSALGVIYNVRLAQHIEILAHNRAYFFSLVFLIPLASVALAGSYWIGWARLPARQTSRVILEAFVFSLAFLLVARTVSDFVFFHLVVPDTYGAADPLAWLKYIVSNRATIGWTLTLSAIAGVAGVLFAATCAAWPSQRRRPGNSAGLALFGALLCLTLYVATIDVVDKSNAKAAFTHPIFTIYELVVVAPVIVAVVAAIIGVRRLRRM